MEHRRRAQAQGEHLEESESWAQNEPLSKNEGLSLLDKLKKKLKKKDIQMREQAFRKAERFIKNGPYRVTDKKISKTFLAPNTKHERVDIEIQKGTAFTDE